MSLSVKIISIFVKLMCKLVTMTFIYVKRVALFVKMMRISVVQLT